MLRRSRGARTWPFLYGTACLCYLWKVDREEARQDASDLQEILVSKEQIESHVGVGRFPEDGDQVGALLERAEAALQAARSSAE